MNPNLECVQGRDELPFLTVEVRFHLCCQVPQLGLNLDCVAGAESGERFFQLAP
jgi:hypothetical protein